MRIFKLSLAFWFALVSTRSLEVFAAPAVDPQDKILVQTAVYLSGIKSVGQLVNLMKATANDADRKFLSSIDKKELEETLPEVSADTKKKRLYFQGLKPLKIVDLASGKFSFDGRDYTFDSKLSAEEALRKLDDFLFPKPVAWLDWILPQAQAVSRQQKGMLMGVFAAMGIMGMMQCFSGQGGTPQAQPQQQPVPQPLPNGQQQQPMPSMGGCGMGMAALLGLFVAMGMKPDDEVKEVKCTVNVNGFQTAQIIGANGRVISTTQGMPGQYVSYPPVSGPVNYGPQMMQICSNPTALGNINQALAAPIVLPPVQQMKGFATRATTPVIQKPGLNTQSQKPSTSGDGRFLEPAGAGSR